MSTGSSLAEQAGRAAPMLLGSTITMPDGTTIYYKDWARDRS